MNYKTKDIVFKCLHVLAWIIFVALCIEAGALIVNFIYSIFKPSVVGHLYQKLDLRQMYAQSKWVFYGMYSYVIFISFLKAALFYTLIQLLLKLDLSKPFNQFVTDKILQISYYTLSIGIISHIAKQTAKNMMKQGYEIDKLGQFWGDSEAFILMAAVIYVIAQIFKRGVALQNENDLTV